MRRTGRRPIGIGDKAAHDVSFLVAFVLGISAIPVPGLHLLACSRDQASEMRIETLRDDEMRPRTLLCWPGTQVPRGSD